MQDSIYIINRTKTLNYRTAEDATAACVAAEHPCRAGGEDNWGAQGFQGCSVSGKASMLIFLWCWNKPAWMIKGTPSVQLRFSGECSFSVSALFGPAVQKAKKKRLGSSLYRV